MALSLLTICRHQQLTKRIAQGHKPSLRGAAIVLSRTLTDIGSCRRAGQRPSLAEHLLEAAMPNPRLISIVEDDQPFRDSMKKLVTLLGYTVKTFPSAADFLASLVLPETACLVADVQMPGMTGLELHRHLVDSGYAIPTILVTAYPDEVVRDRALSDGVVCYLGKPVDDDHLERCLRSAVQQSKPDG
jgi:CheY-like chemotaxis protein